MTTKPKKKIKVIRAWAVICKDRDLSVIGFDNLYGVEVFFRRKDAVNEKEESEKVLPVQIKILNK